MDISIEKKNIVQWIQAIDDEKIIEKILSFKEKNEVSSFENQLIQNQEMSVLTKKLRNVLKQNLLKNENSLD
jgi:hypothetical protein